MARPAHTRVASAAEPAALTWKLVNSKCSPKQEAVGRACWDKAAASGSWDVNEDSATWTTPTYNAHYTYSVPDQIAASGGQVQLMVAVNDGSNNSGIDDQLCVQSPFKLSANSGSDPCAHAHASTPGSSKSGSKDLTLLPSGVGPTGLCPNSAPGSPPECVTLDVEIGSGGNLYFTYRATVAPTISYSFRGTFKSSSSSTAVITGHGSFQIAEPADQGCEDGANDHGSALLQIHNPNRGTHTVHLQSLAGRFCDTRPTFQSVRITYRVTKGTLGCLPVGHRFEMQASDYPGKNGILDIGKCGFLFSHAATVKIHST